MKTINDGGPAFPLLSKWDDQKLNGMTLRDYFAAKAMPAIYRDLWDDVRSGKLEGDPEDWLEGVARDSYRAADAMLKAREAR